MIQELCLMSLINSLN